ncbi:FecR family protein [Sphingomonas faeni]|uniref:FecR family protein n=1 Tax=Sphingomonas faeni TaxID=185950 RepID=UPI00277DE518|nr:FecR domain-containing protein [Sphingomonas faeni]MDQ0839341.1 transmembrane sensor [Sphingomonas faeni]
MSGPMTRRELYGLTSDEAAALWLVRRSGDAPIGDVSVFDAWLAASSENRDAWDRACRMWDRFDDVPDDVLASLRSDALAVTAESRGRRRVFALMAVAAAVVIALSFGMLLRVFPNAPATRTQIASNQPSSDRVLSTGKGQRASAVLSDGTNVQLDAETTMRVAYAQGARRVMLDRGQVFFDVAHDASRPFTVLADGRTVTALGTRFTVRNDPGRYQVALLQGRVRVASRTSARTVTLAPGEKFVAAGAFGSVSNLDVAKVTAWQEGQVEFDDAMLSDAVAEMNRYSAVQLSVTDEALGRMRVSGRFRAGDWLSFSRMVSKVLPLRVVRRSATRVELRPAR